MGRPSKEYEAFTKLTDRLLAVPKDVIHERHKVHKEKSASNPYRRGPKKRRKLTQPSGDDRDASGSKHTG